MNREEWMAEGQRLFGEDIFKWRFQCPVCKNIATPEDYRKYKDSGATADSATCECIGRFLPKKDRGGWSKDHCNPKIKSPCDYASYGLFRFGVEVDGSFRFPFAPVSQLDDLNNQRGEDDKAATESEKEK